MEYALASDVSIIKHNAGAISDRAGDLSELERNEIALNEYTNNLQSFPQLAENKVNSLANSIKYYTKNPDASTEVQPPPKAYVEVDHVDGVGGLDEDELGFRHEKLDEFMKSFNDSAGYDPDVNAAYTSARGDVGADDIELPNGITVELGDEVAVAADDYDTAVLYTF